MKKSRSTPAVPAVSEPAAYSVDEFCAAHGDLSRGMFYILLKDPARAPAIMKVGKRTMVSAEAAREWRQRMTVSVAA